MSIIVRNTRPEDYPQIAALCKAVYPDSIPWSEEQIRSHLNVFPHGQFVAVDSTNMVVGMAASLIIMWDDYDLDGNWRDFTDSGMFTNHDPLNGHTLYGAEIMVNPALQGQGIGKKIYAAREKLVRQLGLLRIRAGARLRGYGTYAGEMSPEDYTIKVVQKKLFDPTLSFQLKHGFWVLSVVSNYLRYDKESLGFAAVIEWTNDEVAKPEDYLMGDPRFKVKA
jgi:GNAT superfamily N-acetyltransferase